MLTDAEMKKITADVAAIPLKWSTKPQQPTMLVAILRGAAQVGSFAKRFPALKSAAGQAAFVPAPAAPAPPRPPKDITTLP
jgi:hypothetical protein